MSFTAQRVSHPSISPLARAGLFAYALSFALQAASAAEWSVDSPNSELGLTVRLAEPAGNLSYSVEQGAQGQRKTVLGEAALGLILEGLDLAHLLKFEAVTAQTGLEENYTLAHGKKRECRNSGNQITLKFRNPNGAQLELDARAYNDGIAWRYRVLGGAQKSLRLNSEATGFALPEGARFWAAPSDKASTYSPGYETYYQPEMDVKAVAPLGLGWSFPFLFRTGDSRCWALITEANVTGAFCGTRLSSAATNGQFTVSFPDPAEGNGQGDSHPSSSLPWEMPWRVVILGNSLATIVESTLVTDLSAPSAVTDTSWVKPGRVAWSWWSDAPSPKSAAAQRKFIDLAKVMGWEYVLVDANWTIMEDGNIHDVLNYAKERGVGVLLWYNSGGPHNVVTEKPRDSLTSGPVREFELKMLKEWGVKGIKVDFFQSDKQEVIGLYRAMLKDSAVHQIMINFHGCTLPRGWERTYPQLMSMEAVRGEECYIFDPKYPEAAPVQNTIIPFTRNAVGPMDYTPVGLSDNRYPHLTTSAHELALAVLFETGWLHFADKPESYLQLPPEPKQFLKEVPTAWDEVRFVDGYPGQFAILARRKGQTWYVAGVNGENRPREAVVPTGKWLANGRYQVTTIADGETPRSLRSKTGNAEGPQELKVLMLPRGGFVIILKPLS